MLVQIQACLNSRPITALSDDPADQLALTPAHFIIRESILQPLSRRQLDVPSNRIKIWSILQKMVEDFWSRWHLKYLHSMSSTLKRAGKRDNLRNDDVVFFLNETAIPSLWELGRLVQVFPGADGQFRSYA